MDEMQIEIYNALCRLSGEEVTDLFLNWLGNQVIDEDFAEFFQNEGYSISY